MNLTEEQKAFVQKHITGLSRTEGRRKTAAYVDYLRRNAKVLAELDRLRGSDQYNALVSGHQEAEVLARDGRFEDAYAGLETVKTLARTASKGYVDGLTYDRISRRILKLKDDAADAMLPIDEVDRRLDKLQQQADTSVFPSPQAELAEDDSSTRRAALVEAALSRKTELLLQLEGIREEAKQAAKGLDDVQIPRRVEQLRQQIEVAKTYGAKTQRRWLGGLDVLLDDAPTEAFLHDQLLDGQRVIANANSRIAEVTDVINQRWRAWIGAFQQRAPGAPPDGGVVSQRTGKRSKTSYTDAERKYDTALETAKQRFKQDSEHDQDLVGKDTLPIPKAKQLATYKLGDALPEELAEKLRGLAPPPEGIDGEGPPPDDVDIDAAARLAAEHVGKTLKESDPGSDVVFDLLLKNPAAFLADLGAELGWDRDMKKWSDAQRQAGEKIANAMAERVRQDSPNKLSDDRASFTFNGRTYKDRQRLGAGGLCTAYRYTCEDDRSSIVLKTPNSSGETTRAGMVDEMRAHRLAMGGEGGKGDRHLVAMLGALIDSSGDVHMLVEECSGGDMKDFAEALNQVTESGALPPEARNALLRAIAGEAAKGLKYVKDQGLTHNDVKDANYLIDGSGTVKIADLGSGRQVDEGGGITLGPDEITPPVTPRYVSPELAKAEDPNSDKRHWTPSSDVFSLGAMLDMLGSGTTKLKVWYFENPDRQTGTTATSFDRLRNAMLEEDPDKRPTIDAILMSSYVDEALDESGPGAEHQDINHDEAIAELKAAIIAYGKGRERRIAELRDEIEALQSKIEANGGKPLYTRQLFQWKQEIAQKQNIMANINEDKVCKDLLAQISMAAKAGTRKPPEDELRSRAPKSPRETPETLRERYGELPPLPS